MTDLTGRKIVVLSGSEVNSKIVKAAKELGVYTIVVDYLPLEVSPAKQIADEHWEISYADYEKLIPLCMENNVQGIVACSAEATQLPYYELCHRLNLPCYASKEQFDILTNKRFFKELCSEYEVDVIPEFNKRDIQNKEVKFPVVVKPVDNGGSKGQTICNDYDELENAIRFAESESASKGVIVEKYIGGKNSFQVTYFFVNGEAFVIRTADGYKGSRKDNMDRVAQCSVSPSIYTQAFFETANEKIVRMLRSIGVDNGPVMIQGFFDNGVFRFYDPGRRFPGTDYELIYREVFGVDLMQMMIEYALTGKMPGNELSNQNAGLNGKLALVLFPTICAGKIGRIEGIDIIRKDSKIRSVVQKHFIGDTIKWTFTTVQRIFDISFLSENMEEAISTIHHIQENIHVFDIEGNNMIWSSFDTNRLRYLIKC